MLEATDLDSFTKALDSADKGERIVLPPNTSIDVSGVDLPALPHDVQLLSGSGADDRPASTIICRDDPDDQFLLEAYGDATIRGLRFIGPEHNLVHPRNEDRGYGALHLHGDRAIVGGCTFTGWPFAGIAIGTRKTETTARVNNCTFRFCIMAGLGYGVELFNGDLKVIGCDFDWTRHAISSFGYPTCSYEARGCRVGPHTLSHAFDQHNVAENLGEEKARNRGFDPQCAGGKTFIHGNRFEFTHDLLGHPQEAIAIRGVPAEVCVISDNDFAHAEAPIRTGGRGSAFRQQVEPKWKHLVHFGNRYGVGVGRSQTGG